MKDNGVLCWKCRKVVPYKVNSRKRVRVIGDKEYEYYEKFGVCDECHEEITVPGLDDENERILDSIYRADNDLITIEEINSLLKRYNIEKRPLSHVLGMGEHTISRYIEGALPSKRYSDMLRNVLAYHGLMRDYLEKNKEKITDAAYSKTDKAISMIEKLCDHNTKTEVIAQYIIHRAYEVTDLSLQKILYFVKAFSWALLGRDIIDEQCEAWAYGPVFPDIYEKYKVLGSDVIRDYDKSIKFDTYLKKDELGVLDHVIDCFGIYNGNVLMRITHTERPWKDARLGIPEFAPSCNLIPNETIHEYYEEINSKYHLGEVKGVKSYIRTLDVIHVG